MDRGIPSEETLQHMRASDPSVGYLVGTPRGRWEQYREEFEKVPWQKMRDTVEVKLLAQGPEVYVLVKSQGRRKKLARLLRTLRRDRQRPWKRDTLLHKLGAAHKEAGGAWRFVKISLPTVRQSVSRDSFKFELLKDKLKAAEERGGHYLLRGFNAGDQAGPLKTRNVVVWPSGNGSSADLPARRFTFHRLIGVNVFAAPLCPPNSPAMTRTVPASCGSSTFGICALSKV